MTNTTLATYGTRLATAFDDRKAQFTRATLIQSARTDGHSLDDIAVALSVGSARRHHPAATDEQVSKLAATPRNKGGFAVSKATVGFYDAAWTALVKAGFAEPDATTFGLMYRITTIGGVADARHELTDTLAALPEGERSVALVKGVERIAEHGNAARRKVIVAPSAVTGGDTIVTPNGNVKPAPKDAPADRKAFEGDTRSEPITSASEKSLGGTLAESPIKVAVSAEVALETISRIAVQEWSPADAARIAEAFAAAADLIGATTALV